MLASSYLRQRRRGYTGRFVPRYYNAAMSLLESSHHLHRGTFTSFRRGGPKIRGARDAFLKCNICDLYIRAMSSVCVRVAEYNELFRDIKKSAATMELRKILQRQFDAV